MELPNVVEGFKNILIGADLGFLIEAVNPQTRLNQCLAVAILVVDVYKTRVDLDGQEPPK